jgi:thioredoxin-related protein
MVYVYNNDARWNGAITEETILADSTVIKALLKDFISVKFDSETKEEVVVKGQKYPFADFGEGNGYNVYTIVLLGGKMGYPTFVFLDKEGEKIGSHFPVKDAAEFLLILKYYSSGAYEEEGASYDEWIKKQ